VLFCVSQSASNDMQRIVVVLLLVILVSSGLGVIFSKHNSRLVFIAIQKTEQELDRLEIRWERLTLEERMLSEHNSVLYSALIRHLETHIIHPCCLLSVISTVSIVA